MVSALLLIDLQCDFLPGGSLAVPHGDEILPLVQEMTCYPFDLFIATKDWHPADHLSFACNHSGKNPGDRITLGGIEQVLWPAHCIQGSTGSEFAEGWDAARIDHVVYKGTNRSIDSYSAFFDNGHWQATGLDDYLKAQEVSDLFIAGLATDYCVKYSVLDALQLGYRVHVILDACRGVELQAGDVARAHFVMQEAGAQLLSFKDVAPLLEEARRGGREF